MPGTSVVGTVCVDCVSEAESQNQGTRSRNSSFAGAIQIAEKNRHKLTPTKQARKEEKEKLAAEKLFAQQLKKEPLVQMFKASVSALHKLISSQEEEVVSQIVSRTLVEKEQLKKHQSAVNSQVKEMKQKITAEKKLWQSKFGGTLDDAVAPSMPQLLDLETQLAKITQKYAQFFTSCSCFFFFSSLCTAA